MYLSRKCLWVLINKTCQRIGVVLGDQFRVAVDFQVVPKVVDVYKILMNFTSTHCIEINCRLTFFNGTKQTSQVKFIPQRVFVSHLQLFVILFDFVSFLTLEQLTTLKKFNYFFFVFFCIQWDILARVHSSVFDTLNSNRRNKNESNRTAQSGSTIFVT